MFYLLFVAGVLAIGYAFPKASNFMAYILTFGFIFPFLTLAAGTLGWAFMGLFFGGMPWTASVLLFGLPFGGLMVAFIMSGTDL